MARLKDRQKQIPGGFKFAQPQIAYTSTPWISFDRLVDELIEKRMSNPTMTRKNGWATDRGNVETEVEAYQVRLCQKFGWNDFLAGSGGPPPQAPKPFPPLAALRNVAAGAKALAEWDISGEVVDREVAEHRASICLDCPMNKAGNLTDWFTEQASNWIKVQLEKRNERKLSTSDDEHLNICDACFCPIKLKVWAPMGIIQKNMTAEAKSRLDKRCWILKG